MPLLDGEKLSKRLISQLKDKIKQESSKLRLEIILTTDDYASNLYVKKKQKMAKSIGIISNVHYLQDTNSEDEIIDIIKKLNNDNSVNGIMVQLPINQNFNKYKILESIDPKKDVDGLTSTSLGKLYKGLNTFVSATPMGVMTLLDKYNIDLKGKNCVIIGRSDIVGLPLNALLIKKNATVTIVHRDTKDIKNYTKNADIIFSAIGKPKYITSDYISKNSILIDIGTSRDENTSKLSGDFDFDNIKNKVQAITPVPGGVGPMTIYSLLANTYKSFLQNSH